MKLQMRSLVCGAVTGPLLLVVATIVFGGDAVVPHNFVPGTPALAAEVNANFASLQDAINANTPRRTLIQYTGQLPNAVPTPTQTLLRTLGSFTKRRADTSVRIDWHSPIYQGGTQGDFVEYQIRLSGVQANGNHTGAVIYSNAAFHVANVATFEVFTGLAAGDYDVEIWIRGTATAIQENFGSFQAQALVTESYTN